MGRVERRDDLRLGHFLRAGLDHHQAVFAAGDDEIELAALALLEGRVDEVLTVEQTDADAGDRLLERDFREGQRGRRAGHRQHVGVVLGVGREDQRDDLRLVAPAGGEERPDRPVDDAAGQHFLFGGLAFAFEESARDSPGGVGVLTVVDREWQEVDALSCVGGATGRDEHDRIAEANDDRAAGLFGQLAGFE